LEDLRGWRVEGRWVVVTVCSGTWTTRRGGVCAVPPWCSLSSTNDGKQQLYVTFLDYSVWPWWKWPLQRLVYVTSAWIIHSRLATFMVPCHLSFWPVL